MAHMVHKYMLSGEYLGGPQTVKMHKGAKILSFQNQRETPTIWVSEDESEEIETRVFYLVMTGSITPAGEFIGTAMFDKHDFVLHCFSLRKPA